MSPDAARDAYDFASYVDSYVQSPERCVKLLLDENVPAPMTATVKTLLRRSHDVQHVTDMPGWSGTKDLHLYGWK